MKNEKGFTLIEMLIVLLIISVLILVTIPNVTTKDIFDLAQRKRRENPVKSTF